MPLLGNSILDNDALGWVLDLAHDDQLHYLKYGSPETDYGSEWPEVAKQRAAWCRAIAEAATIAGETERWEELATKYEETLEEFRCEGCGRLEAVCSADPCAGVIADRQEGEELPGLPLLKCSDCGEDLEGGQSGKCEDCGSGCCPDCGEPTENGKQCAGCITAERTREGR
jgi:hypothetical protein